MPATPAWPPASTPRLYVEQPLEGLGSLTLDGPPAHYLGTVMRLKAGDPVRLFDDISGEWLAEVTAVARRTVDVALVSKLAEREQAPDLWLLAAPIKKGRIDWTVEKACELGVDRFVPVVTRRSVVDKVNPERLRAHMIEAAEQCGRTALPQMEPLIKLERLLADWPEGRRIYFADETGGAAFATAITPGPAAILIGPEGGFTEEERALLRAHEATCAVSLGPRILRADTAAVAAISLWMAMAGDWAS